MEIKKLYVKEGNEGLLENSIKMSASEFLWTRKLISGQGIKPEKSDVNEIQGKSSVTGLEYELGGVRWQIVEYKSGEIVIPAIRNLGSSFFC